MKDLLLGVHVVVKTLTLEISHYLLRRLGQRILLKGVALVQHDYIPSFNQSDHRNKEVFVILVVATGNVLIG